VSLIWIGGITLETSPKKEKSPHYLPQMGSLTHPPGICGKKKKSALPPSNFAKFCFSSLNSKTK